MYTIIRRTGIKSIILLAYGTLFLLISCSFLYADTISNVRYYHISDDRIVIYYDLECTGASSISVEVSLDGGKNYSVIPQALSGDIGDNVSRGKYKRIVWEVYKDIDSVPGDLTIRILTVSRLEPVSLIINTPYEDEKTITAYSIDSPIKIDGLLNEPSWKNAVPASDFIQRELTEGSPATEKTEVRILYDSDNMYIGVMCFDKEPEKIIHNELRVDGYLEEDDNFSLVLDTFNDKRGGFFFCINPNGARFDGKVTGSRSRSGSRSRTGGSSSSGNVTKRSYINKNWNGVWDAAAEITGHGWSAEIIIPFKTLRFTQAEVQNWGINFCREIARKKEEDLWSSWLRNDGMMQLSKSGVLTGLRNVKRGRQIEFKPFTLAGLEKEEKLKRDLNYGLDVKYPVTSDLTLDLTTFTDFAQVESDREMINLTRFDLYYPEKREFFLEGAEIFNFGSHYSTPFYTRRIGITPDREQQVPILAGARLTGKAGSYNLGILNMQTENKGEYPSSNYSVIRVKKDILERSYIGIIATNYFNKNKDNQAFGADFYYKTDEFLKNKNLIITGSMSESKTPEINKGNRTGRISINLPNDLSDIWLYYKVVGENYDPEMGFVRRNGIKQTMARFTYTPRPGIPYVKKLSFSPLMLTYITDMDNKLLTRTMEFTPFGFNTTTDEDFRFNIKQSHEYLEEDFNIFNDVIIPVGIYTWWNYEAVFTSNLSRPFSMYARFEWGDFYNGESDIYDYGCNFKVNKHFTFSTDMTHNYVTIGTQSFNAKEYRGRVNINISTRLTSRTFIQWNNETNEASINFRFHYIPKIGSDIYLVYNHIWDSKEDYKTIYNTGMSKIAYLIRF